MTTVKYKEDGVVWHEMPYVTFSIVGLPENVPEGCEPSFDPVVLEAELKEAIVTVLGHYYC